ncbi:MAG: ACP S-malonyltransferase [PVC group bacterium]|nr:ACP S-malonyltransferase [PVC group bacterium]
MDIKGKKIAFIFPGQGAQYVGMGKDLCEQFEVAAKIFKTADEVLGFDLSRICFEGPLAELTQSAVCQPAVLTHSIACLEILKSEFDLKPEICAGLSLGEYSALVACGSLSFDDAVRLVNKRGQFMDEASQQNPGTMSCLLGITVDQAKNVCLKAGVEIANLNCPGQIVISGKKEAIGVANEMATEAGAKRVIPLGVSGPFHSSLMSPAAKKLTLELENVSINKPEVPFICNVTADYVEDAAKIKEFLVQQVAHTTHWHDTIIKMKQSGVEAYVEIGPGKVLKGLLQRIERGLQVVNLEKGEDFAKLEGSE